MRKQLSFEGAYSFIEQLHGLYSKEGWRQLTPKLMDLLDESIEVIAQNDKPSKHSCQLLEDAKFLKKHMYGITFIRNTL